jgi:hypothetical protein
MDGSHDSKAGHMTTPVNFPEVQVRLALREFILHFLSDVCDFKGGIEDNVLTVSEVLSGEIQTGQFILGPGVLVNSRVLGPGVDPGAYLLSTRNGNVAAGTTLMSSDMEVIAAHDNRVPMPVAPFIMIEWNVSKRLATNEVRYSNIVPETLTGDRNEMQRMQAGFQVDCFGPNSANWANVIATAFRSQAGVEFFQPWDGIDPLYADDPRHVPLIDGEAQYLERWTLNAFFQVNLEITLPQDFVDHAEVTVIPVQTL